MGELPSFVKQGEPARLFPVVSSGQGERRIASIFLALLQQIPTLATEILLTAGVRVGKRTQIRTFTEVVCRSDEDDLRDRPDGLIVVSTGKREWSALVEVKCGKTVLDADQVIRYLSLAKRNGIDAVITISNQFTARYDQPPFTVPKRFLHRVSLLHWPWMWIATRAKILQHQKVVEDPEQSFLLEEFIRFLDHPSSGLERFTRMGPKWGELVQLDSSRASLDKRSSLVEEAVSCWLQEEVDLAFQLSRHIGRPVDIVMKKAWRDDPTARLEAGIATLVEQRQLVSLFRIPDAAADMKVVADLSRRAILVSMNLLAPRDRKSTKARLNWLLRMLKEDDPRLVIRGYWVGRGTFVQESLASLRENPNLFANPGDKSAVSRFEIVLVENIGRKFGGRQTFIVELERIVTEFYDRAGQYLKAWQPSPPKPVETKDAKEARESKVSAKDLVEGKASQTS